MPYFLCVSFHEILYNVQTGSPVKNGLDQLSPAVVVELMMKEAAEAVEVAAVVTAMVMAMILAVPSTRTFTGQLKHFYLVNKTQTMGYKKIGTGNNTT